MVKSTRELLPPQPLLWENLSYLGHGHVASICEVVGYDDVLSFLHIPPLASRKVIKDWEISPVPFEIVDYAAYPPENVIAIPEFEER